MGTPGREAGATRSSAALLARFGHLEAIPDDWRTRMVNAANPRTLAETLHRERDRALLFRDLATLRTHLSLFDAVDDLQWRGPSPAFADLAAVSRVA